MYYNDLFLITKIKYRFMYIATTCSEYRYIKLQNLKRNRDVLIN